MKYGYGASVAGKGIPVLEALDNPYIPPLSNHIETHYQLLGRRSILRWATNANYTACNVFQYGPTVNDSMRPGFVLSRLWHGGHTRRLVKD